MQNEKRTSRRAFVQRLLSVGAAGLGAGSLLSACGGGSEKGSSEKASACTDLSGLSEEQIAVRESFNYVNETPHPDKRCDNCQFYAPDKAGPSCPGCTLFAGPVKPEGCCTSWVAAT